MRQVIVATSNAHKARELEEMLNIPDFKLITLDEAGIKSDPVEDSDEFVGNATIKALEASKICSEKNIRTCILADDSGICIDALEGRPGVLSARYAGDGAGQEAINKKIFAELKGVPFEKRGARFVCALAFVDEDEHLITVEGQVEGRVGFEPCGESGFGYDPIFFPKEYDYQKSFGEVSAEEKNLISHRARAVNLLRERLIN